MGPAGTSGRALRVSGAVKLAAMAMAGGCPVPATDLGRRTGGRTVPRGGIGRTCRGRGALVLGALAGGGKKDGGNEPEVPLRGLRRRVPRGASRGSTRGASWREPSRGPRGGRGRVHVPGVYPGRRRRSGSAVGDVADVRDGGPGRYLVRERERRTRDESATGRRARRRRAPGDAGGNDVEEDVPRRSRMYRGGRGGQCPA